MELVPDTSNVLYLDEGRRNRVMRQLNIAREQGRVAIFNAVNSTDADVIPFPQRVTEDEPDGAA